MHIYIIIKEDVEEVIYRIQLIIPRIKSRPLKGLISKMLKKSYVGFRRKTRNRRTMMLNCLFWCIGVVRRGEREEN